MGEEKLSVSFCATLYSLVFLFVRVLIQPFLITLTPSTLLPTWHTFALLDLFHLISWNRCPIRFLHLSVARGFACSTTLLVPLASLLNGILVQCWRGTFVAVVFSHEATPLSSNLIDMKESTKKDFGVRIWWLGAKKTGAFYYMVKNVCSFVHVTKWNAKNMINKKWHWMDSGCGPRGPSQVSQCTDFWCVCFRAFATIHWTSFLLLAYLICHVYFSISWFFFLIYCRAFQKYLWTSSWIIENNFAVSWVFPKIIGKVRRLSSKYTQTHSLISNIFIISPS